MEASGFFIVLEGIDGCGSTTQAQLLAGALRAKGRRVTATAQPSGGVVGKLIRQALVGGDAAPRFDWATMALLFAADRLHHVQEVIEPALQTGQVVICDRYDLSSLAYQSATSSGGQSVVDWIRQLNRLARRPNLTLVFDIDPDVAEARRKARGQPEELFEKRELQRRLAKLYTRAESLVPADKVAHIDAGAEPHIVHQQVLEIVTKSTQVAG
jgi:dTMP kinase